MVDGPPEPSYPERLKTFDGGFWDGAYGTALQLAAIGHVYDRPPLEALEEGSRCVSCGAFVRREMAIRALEGDSGSYEAAFRNFEFHRRSCIRLQIRIPLEPQATIGGLYGGFRMQEMRQRFEKMSRPTATQLPPPDDRNITQSSYLFSLPTELRLSVYALVLPVMDHVTHLEPLNRDSPRVVTSRRGRPRDYTRSNLLRTCRTIHNEALDMLYTNTTYQFDSTKVLYLFLRQIGLRGRQLLKSVDVMCGHREDAIAFALLASCEKLRSITIRLQRPKILFPLPPLWMADGMACLLELSGLQNVSFAMGGQAGNWMTEEKADALIIRNELCRPKGSAGGLRWVDGHLDV